MISDELEEKWTIDHGFIRCAARRLVLFWGQVNNISCCIPRVPLLISNFRNRKAEKDLFL